MGLGEWLKGFRSLHLRFKDGQLAPEEVKTYRAGRDELAKALLAAQHVAVRAGETPRRQLRVTRALQADLDLGREKVRAMTLDVSAGGFGALMARPPVLGDQLKVSLRLPGQYPVASVARVVDVRAQPGNARVAFAFVNLDPVEQERLETWVFDVVLDQL